MRQLESLIRLSEAMARLHHDDTIIPAYVREVCRLLKQSNINIVKNDIEFEDNQNAINMEREQNRMEQDARKTNDLFVSSKTIDPFCVGHGS